MASRIIPHRIEVATRDQDLLSDEMRNEEPTRSRRRLAIAEAQREEAFRSRFVKSPGRARINRGLGVAKRTDCEVGKL
jgi:hypothetical protein